MSFQTGAFFTSTDGLKLYTQTTPSLVSPIRGVVHLVHGMFEYSGRFMEFVEKLAIAGFIVRMYDQRGHGRSAGVRGHTPSYAHLLHDLEIFLEEGQQLYPHLPHFLYGHSMGGSLVTNFAIRKKPKIQGVVASAPWFRLAFRPESWKIHLGRIVERFWPSFTQNTGTGIEPSAITRDVEELRKYADDKYMHTQISLRFFLEATAAGEWVIRQSKHFPVPLYLYHGTDDYVTSLDASEQFAADVPKELLRFEILEGNYHDIFHDLGREEVYEKVISWLNQQLD